MAQSQRCRGVATAAIHNDNGVKVIYHQTLVVDYDKASKTIRLDTGGWFTNTTKLRMNQASNEFCLGYWVSQVKGKWYVNYKGQKHEFKDDFIILNAE